MALGALDEDVVQYNRLQGVAAQLIAMQPQDGKRLHGCQIHLSL